MDRIPQLLKSRACCPSGTQWRPERWCLLDQPGRSTCTRHCSDSPSESLGWRWCHWSLGRSRHTCPQLSAKQTHKMSKYYPYGYRTSAKCGMFVNWRHYILWSCSETVLLKITEQEGVARLLAASQRSVLQSRIIDIMIMTDSEHHTAKAKLLQNKCCCVFFIPRQHWVGFFSANKTIKGDKSNYCTSGWSC